MNGIKKSKLTLCAYSTVGMYSVRGNVRQSQNRRIQCAKTLMCEQMRQAVIFVEFLSGKHLEIAKNYYYLITFQL